MNFNNSLQLTQSQKLVMTTQLKQSLAILNMSKLELDEEIKREAESNPLLDVEKGSEINWEEYIKDIEKSSYRDKGEVNYNPDNDINLENMVKYSSNLYEHLLLQISLYKLRENEREICEYIIECLDEDGYLRIDDKEIINTLGIDRETFEDCLANIQQLEPNGVGARDISECLIIQMNNLGIYNEVLENIVSNDLHLIASNKYKE
ncbi:MAG: RNA polymerase factor sigma-54, partial [Romboutsia sp.]